MNGRELADRLGIAHFTEHPNAGESAWPTELEVGYFKSGDPAHTLVARDGTEIPKGLPVGELRDLLAQNNGIILGPHGTKHPVTIPNSVLEGENYYVSLKFTARKPGT